VFVSTLRLSIAAARAKSLIGSLICPYGFAGLLALTHP
jgi:hypothetical protein